MINWRGVPYYIAKSILGPQGWRACLREIQRSDISRLGRESLDALLSHASENVPHYRLLRLRGQPLACYPILSKEQLRKSPGAFVRDDTPDQGWPRVRTSGSTGQPLEIRVDHGSRAWFEATDVWYLKELLSTPWWKVVSRSKVRLWHRSDDPPTPFPHWYRLVRFLAPRVWLDPYAALTHESLAAYARAINTARPAYIWGFAGALYELARVALQTKLRLHRPRFIISSGETLHPFMRAVVEEAFGCRVYNHYGAAEVGHVAGECRTGNLHVFTFSCAVEVLDQAGNPQRVGGTGRLILTPLHNYAMPLIRYDTADTAEVGPTECPCGCSLPTLARITGRVVEFFVTQDQRLLSGGAIAHLMRPCEWVLSFQILQEDVDHVTIYYQPMPGIDVVDEDTHMVSRRIKELMGTACKVAWREVEEIPRTSNGKRPYARSLVWESRQPMNVWDEP